uniref:Solute carrier family 35 member B1 n=1 Tax=Phallusia mammillata TaxID=59560 RepID=A0A6F9DS08_9ASCI|nr:solute carrier family 35 member B1 [Phallusia mammillata]
MCFLRSMILRDPFGSHFPTSPVCVNTKSFIFCLFPFFCSCTYCFGNSLLMTNHALLRHNHIPENLSLHCTTTDMAEKQLQTTTNTHRQPLSNITSMKPSIFIQCFFGLFLIFVISLENIRSFGAYFSHSFLCEVIFLRDIDQLHIIAQRRSSNTS